MCACKIQAVEPLCCGSEASGEQEVLRIFGAVESFRSFTLVATVQPEGLWTAVLDMTGKAPPHSVLLRICECSDLYGASAGHRMLCCFVWQLFLL